MTPIAVLASGGGTNFQALLDACRSGRIPGKIALLIVSRESAGAKARAEQAGIPVVVTKDPARMLEACERAGVALVCLAGWLSMVAEPFLSKYAGRILNIHPALLPKFGGKGMYGVKVHEAVLAAKESWSGCSVHLVDAEYDHGAVVGRAFVPVHPDDSAADLQRRVLKQEHWLYPEVVRRFCLASIPNPGGNVPMPVATQNKVIKRALISVSDKTGVVEFAKALAERGIEIISTSGTAKALEQAGVPVRPLSSMTGFPEILGGRVKTLHPKIHGAILYRRKDQGHVAQAQEHDLEGIDLVAVNLYPFAETAKKVDDPFDPELMEQIDIGGPTLVRASAKNHEDVVILTSPNDYNRVLESIDNSKDGGVPMGTRRELAKKAFAHTAAYDSMISDKLSQGGTKGNVNLELVKVQDLRYGENPHQAGALYKVLGAETPYEQLHGKELSYNNVLDFEGTWETVCDFERPAVVINKHVTPSGVGVGDDLLEAWKKAWASDPVSAFGGVAAFNRTVTEDIVADMKGKFVEVITAPGYTPAALERLKKRANIRILVRKSKPSAAMQYRWAGDLVLAHEPDRQVFGAEPKVVTKRAPSGEEYKALRFAWTAAKAVRSNAIVLAVEDATVGIGAGQMSRIDSVHMAGLKFEAWKRHNDLGGRPVALASDAFFPFRDGVDACAKLGITCLVEPGGSVRDDEVVAAADEHGLAMIFTGMRHFRH